MEDKKTYSGKKHFIYLVAFIVCILIFVWVLTGWVKKNADSYSVEDELKNKLSKNPVKTNVLSQNSAQNQANVSGISQADQSESSPENPSETENVDNSSIEEDGQETETEKEDEEKNKFESSNLKISFEYPKDIAVEEEPSFVTLTKENTSWKIRLYENKNKKDFNSWYLNHFDIKDSTKCTFTDATVKVGSYESKLVKPSSDSNKCKGDGNFAMSSDKARIIKIELGNEVTENVNKILTSFKFVE